MRIARITIDGLVGVAIKDGDEVRAVVNDPSVPDIDTAVQAGPAAVSALAALCRSRGRLVEEKSLDFLPPLIRSPKIICVGLNYQDHAAETSFDLPTFPTLFGRFSSGLVGHGQPIIKPRVSDQFDFEGEMVAVIGTGGRDIARSDALDHVFAYSVFNDVSVRDFQMKTPQWTVGKNFDGTGPFGPWLVTADELPLGGSGLAIETRLNGHVVQKASTSNMVFSVVDLIELLSRFMTLEAGDILVTGTPAGVGMSRTPPLYMRNGDVCEVEIEAIGLLSNYVVEQ